MNIISPKGGYNILEPLKYAAYLPFALLIFIKRQKKRGTSQNRPTTKTATHKPD